MNKRKNQIKKPNYKLLGTCVIIIFAILMVGLLQADQLVHKFGSPAFNGQNQSAHYLTIDEQERTRQEKIAEEIQDVLEEAEREADNTVLAKFIRNLESRIYSTLAKDISES